MPLTALPPPVRMKTDSRDALADLVFKRLDAGTPVHLCAHVADGAYVADLGVCDCGDRDAAADTPAQPAPRVPQPGDVVVLKTGSPRMTVGHVFEPLLHQSTAAGTFRTVGPLTAECYWFDNDAGAGKQSCIPIAGLNVVTRA